MAPTDSAFADWDLEYVAKLVSSTFVAHLNNFLGLHTLDGSISVGDLVDLSSENMNNASNPKPNTAVAILAGNNETLTFNVDVQGGDDEAQVQAAVSIESPHGNNTATVVSADHVALNGVLHTIDVILQPLFVGVSVLDVLVREPSLTVIAELMEIAGVASLIPPGLDLTLLAPANEAFADFPGGPPSIIEYFRDNDVELRTLILQHVVLGVEPLERLQDGDYFLSQALIIRPNLLARDGLTHILDRVLLSDEQSESCRRNCGRTFPLRYPQRPR